MSIRLAIAKAICRSMARYDEKSERGRVIPPGVRAEKDVTVPGALPADVYVPENYAADELPLLFDVHGGGLMYGHKGLNERFCRAVASLGFTVVSAEYRLAPQATLPEMLTDVCRAARFFADSRGTNGFYLAGDSAGAMLALLADAAASSETVRAAFGLAESDVAPRADGLLLISGMFCFRRRGARALAGVPVGKGGWLSLTRIPDLTDVYLPRRAFLASSDGDFLRSSTLRLAKELEARGAEFALDMRPKRSGAHKFVHVYPVRDPEWQESADMLARAAAFLRGGEKRQ